jgi:putative membrane protein
LARAAPVDAADPMLDIAAASFVPMVASSNTFEIRSSGLAQDKATTQDVKDFASQMVEDHSKAGEDLRGALGEAQLPAAPLSPKHAAMIKMLEEAEGAEFERLYIDMQAGAHQEAVSLFRTFASSGDDAELVSFAEATLPTLEAHMMHISEIVAVH